MKTKTKTNRIKTGSANPSLGEQLRHAIETDERSVYAICKAAGVAPSVVGRYLTGERDLRLATAGRLAAELGLELQWFPK